MVKGERVKWVDGMGFEHHGIVARDTDTYEFMIPIERRDGTVIKVAYRDLHLVA